MSAAPEALAGVFDRLFTDLSQARAATAPQLVLNEVGTITNVATGIAKVSGLPSMKMKSVRCCSVTTRSSRRVMKCGARAASWMWAWAMD
jgi:hypothetical protein